MAKLPKKEEELNAHHTEAYHLPDGVTLHVRRITVFGVFSMVGNFLSFDPPVC